MQLAATLAAARGAAAEATVWAAKLSSKQVEGLETPILEEAKARTKLDKHMDKVRSGFGSWSLGCGVQG